MTNLRDREWQSIYESKPEQVRAHLVKDFYEPALERSQQYDRIAGYFSSTALAAAANGIHALVENDGEMRLIVGTELYESDRPVLETLTDRLEENLEDLDDERLDANLRILARLLREGRIHIKVAYPRSPSHDWEIFHPKVGLFHDSDGNTISFEGSVNETVGGWARNYERFKVHRSWVPEQADYVAGDEETFERLWRDEHPFVEVYDLPDAIEEDIIDWKAPDTESDLQEAIQIANGTAPPTERDKANIIQDGPFSPGGLALAEEASTITPWPHQRVVSDTLVNTYPQSFLLCDEVGLGKTIEAGLTLSRLGLTGELETGLLLVPASLQRQWQEELWEKFNINAVRFDRDTAGDHVFRDVRGRDHYPPSATDLDLTGESEWADSPIWRFLYEQQSTDADASSPLDGPTVVIMSWHTARLDDRWDQVAPLDRISDRSRNVIPASCRGRDHDTEDRMGVWDAVIVDEAHNARRGSNFYALLEQLRDYTHAYYLLTATPMQLHSGELYDLMQLLDLPGGWDNRDTFMEFFETRDGLSQALNEVLDNPSSESDEAEASWDTQATLDGMEHQDRLPTDRPFSSKVFQHLADELEINEDGQDCAIAKECVLTACRLARAYGDAYDGYLAHVDDAMVDYDIDRFEASEDTKLKRLLYPEDADEWLMASRSDRQDALDELSPGGWRVIRDVLAESTPVDALIHRNTRDTLRKYEAVGLLDTTVPNRNPEQRKIELTEETRAVYDQIDEYTREFYKRAQQTDEAQTRAIGFVMTTYRQRLTSSVYAISQSLRHRLETLRAQRTVLAGRERARDRDYGDAEQVVLETLQNADLDDGDVLDELDASSDDLDLSELIPSVTEEGKQLIEEEIEALEAFVNDLDLVDTDPKIQQLYNDLDELDRAGHNRVIVFTQYADTMDFIRDSLADLLGATIATYSGRGGELYDPDSETWEHVGKERVKREFSRDDGQVDILVCTDSASEGLNLQECGALINYDLPWNPMRVEQRIGRIDRIGQRFDEIRILNYSYEDTVETDIYDRLDDRIGLFENVVGEMQPILSGVSQQIRDATLNADSADDQSAVESADREFSEELEERDQGDRVDVGESLEDVDDLVAQDVVDEAKLDAWQSYSHPDLVDVGEEEYEYQPPFETPSLQSVLVDNDALAEAGVEFTPIHEIDFEYDDGDFDFADSTYRLSVGDAPIEVPPGDGEQTIAQAIATAADEVAVTFSAVCADEFPSVQHLAPGHPLLGQILTVLQDVSEEPSRFQQRIVTRPDQDQKPVVCAWGRDGVFTRIAGDGTVAENGPMDSLPTWCDQFLDNREKSTKQPQ
ncbi:helicase-related protein [Halalkaliarchaeum sp. AArc-GB]|uniref:helicase-related protein n=1 Tax=Halalkaliarchaeum sp. AArc-GB TaxID=3074078 RepID=UPI0028629CA5|nr:helicase-related protein [Halalkaliarchaeum sp. AArc-GB]MDR5673620.1 helicase-related protein [Halalkaliarchaeum sp. AArc-GB]